jgi:hypothetical protein
LPGTDVFPCDVFGCVVIGVEFVATLLAAELVVTVRAVVRSGVPADEKSRRAYSHWGRSKKGGP